MKRKSLNSHYSSSMKSDTYLSPKWIIDSLGEFDLDPCTPDFMPWKTANKRYTKKDDGLSQPWHGRVWLNPPYSREAVKWMRKMKVHNNGIALLMARTETKDWFETIWDNASGILFLKGRIYFHDINGERLKINCGASPALISYGEENFNSLSKSGIPGKIVSLNRSQIIIVGFTSSWYQVVSLSISKVGSDEELKPIYDFVEMIAPDKVSVNKHWREKVRQKVYEFRKKTFHL